MLNQGRVALLRAIRAMSRAAASLTVADLPPALTHERAALAGLEQAFSRSRILLRALTEREKLDLSRRLTGSLTDVTRDVHPTVEPEENVRVADLRKALASIASVASQRTFATDASATIASVGTSMLRIDPSNKALQDVAANLSSATAAIDRGRSEDAHRDLERAVTGLASVLRVSPARRSARAFIARSQSPRRRDVRRASPTSTEMNRPTLRLSLRSIAILIAVSAVLDPAMTSMRSPKARVAVVAADRARDSTLARRVARSLDGRFAVIDAPLSVADATVLVGETFAERN